MNQWIVFRKLSESLLFSGNLYTSFFHSVTFWSPKWRSFKIPLKVGHEWTTQTSHAWITWLWKTFHQQPTSWWFPSTGTFRISRGGWSACQWFVCFRGCFLCCCWSLEIISHMIPLGVLLSAISSMFLNWKKNMKESRGFISSKLPGWTIILMVGLTSRDTPKPSKHVLRIVAQGAI